MINDYRLNVFFWHIFVFMTIRPEATNNNEIIYNSNIILFTAAGEQTVDCFIGNFHASPNDVPPLYTHTSVINK